MKVSKNSKYQTHKKSIKLTKNPSDRTGALKEGTLSHFSTSIVAKHQKIEGGYPSVSPGTVCYAEKQEKNFWFSSLGQMIQFGTIKFCRTFKNYFGQFVWIEKSYYNSRLSLHEAPTENNHKVN